MLHQSYGCSSIFGTISIYCAFSYNPFVATSSAYTCGLLENIYKIASPDNLWLDSLIINTYSRTPPWREIEWWKIKHRNGQDFGSHGLKQQLTDKQSHKITLHLPKHWKTFGDAKFDPIKLSVSSFWLNCSASTTSWTFTFSHPFQGKIARQAIHYNLALISRFQSKFPELFQCCGISWIFQVGWPPRFPFWFENGNLPVSYPSPAYQFPARKLTFRVAIFMCTYTWQGSKHAVFVHGDPLKY